jgi:hypothetical protein
MTISITWLGDIVQTMSMFGSQTTMEGVDSTNATAQDAKTDRCMISKIQTAEAGVGGRPSQPVVQAPTQHFHSGVWLYCAEFA